MDQTAIFGPFFATMFLTLLVWVYMYVRRITFITKNKISPRDLCRTWSTCTAFTSRREQSIGQL